MMRTRGGSLLGMCSRRLASVSLPLAIAPEGVEAVSGPRLVKRKHNNSRALDQIVQDGNGVAAAPRNQDDLRFQQS